MRIKKAGKQKQKLLTDLLMKELPQKKREKLLKEEKRKRRLELQEAKENIWKRWRGKSVEKDENAKESGENMLELMIKQDREEKGDTFC